jgi:hypothetical protein
MDMKTVVQGEGLDAAIDDLFSAVLKYREFLKRNHPDRLAGVLFVRRGTDFLVYSESERYTQELLRLTWDARGDSWSTTEYVHDPDNEFCPLNDPETCCNPALAGLTCTCNAHPSP